MKISSGRSAGIDSAKAFAKDEQRVTPVQEAQAEEKVIPEKESAKKGTEWPLLDPRIEALKNSEPKGP